MISVDVFGVIFSLLSTWSYFLVTELHALAGSNPTAGAMAKLLSIFLISEYSGERQVVFRYPLDPFDRKDQQLPNLNVPTYAPLDRLVDPNRLFIAKDHPLASVSDRPAGYPLTGEPPCCPDDPDTTPNAPNDDSATLALPISKIDRPPSIVPAPTTAPSLLDANSTQVPGHGYTFTDQSRGLQYYAPSVAATSAVSHRPREPRQIHEQAKVMTHDSWSHESGLGLSNKVILTFIARKSALLNRRFQTTVGNLMFLGLPMAFTLPAKPALSMPATPTERARTMQGSTALASDLGSAGIAFGSRSQPCLLLANHHHLRHHRAWAAQRTRPTEDKFPALNGGLSTSNTHDAPTWPEATLDYDFLDLEGGSSRANGTVPDASSPQYQLTMFNLLFVLDYTDSEAEAKADLIYHHVIAKLCTVLGFAQRSNQYVSTEINRLSKILESAISENYTYAEWIAKACEQSTLARAIAQVYDAVCHDQVAHLQIDGRYNLSLQVPPLHKNLWAEMSQEELTDKLAAYPYIRPQQILLPLQPPEQILRSIPMDANISLRLLIKELSNRRALGDLHSVIDCSLAQMYQLAAHLIYWRKAKVINKPKLGCEYIVSPKADLSKIREYNEEFQMRYPGINLLEFLAAFSTPKSFLKHIQSIDPKHRGLYFKALEYLLSRDLVTELHTYAYAKTPSTIKPVFPWDQPAKDTNMAPSGTPTTKPAAGATGPSAVNDDTPLTQTSDKPSSKSAKPGDLTQWQSEIDQRYNTRKKRFSELFDYLDGKHSTYEIHYLLQIPFSDLKTALKLYRSHLIMMKHC
ncbi:Nitrogen permease regulator 3 [Dimargaris xerosporica]|nr:Nitrogen permease regulator 3 [Dimargaris xerosporica]